MATLVSPGVSVTVTDESFFIPVSAPTVPLLFIATADDKLQPDGVTPADGTFEHDVIRTVTSLEASTQLYGVPRFLEDPGTGEQFHGDARNEYGVFALNQYLGIGNRAFVIRSNVNLNDDLDDLRDLWDRKMSEAAIVLENLINEFINEFNAANGFIPSDPGFKITVTRSEYLSLADQATQAAVFGCFSFENSQPGYFDDHTSSPFDVFANGYDQPATGVFLGLTGLAIDWETNSLGGSPNPDEFTAAEGANLALAAADDYKFTQDFLTTTSLGANDAARRVAITTALQASMNSNTEIRAETFDYNLILCPGYQETVDEMLALVVDIQEEALVIGDTPNNLNPDGITNPSTGWAVSTERQNSINVSYYYPQAFASNLDGVNVVVAASGVALRTYAFNDRVSFLWFAPAGTRRGVITGISNLGYVSGLIGTAGVEFNEVALNQGQRDAMYQDAPSGRINPLVFFPGQGFLVWGQKTSAPQPSALDRVNVSRLVKYIKRQLRRNTLSFVFEPNDQLTRDNLKAVVDAFLGDLVVKRGLFDFATVSDTSNNTPVVIDRNEMIIDVAIKPVKAAEFIFIPIRVVSTGAEI